MAESNEEQYRPITPAFFDKEWREGFDIFYEVPAGGGNTKFVKFGEFDPENFARLKAVLQEKQHETFYVREADLHKYFKFNILKHLLLGLAQDQPPAGEVFERVYPVATRILQDYLEIPASDDFLNLLDEIPKALSDVLEYENLPFQQLFALTSKENSVHVHCVNVGLYCLCLGRHLGMVPEDREALCLGGLLADIGKKFIPQDVLFKETKLTNEDMRVIRRHPALGKQMLGVRKRYSATVLKMAAEHHENYDGTGYPLGIGGNKISLAGRICKIMDVFNALTSRRSYGEVMPPGKALSLMNEKIGEQFDPEFLTAMILYARGK